jgi:hypothetical protein
MIPLLASGEAVSRYPITGIGACCARAPTGYAAAPQRAAINSRRLIMTNQQRWSAKTRKTTITFGAKNVVWLTHKQLRRRCRAGRFRSWHVSLWHADEI